MALTFPTKPTAPTPPAVEKGDGANSHAKIDAPNFFQVPFVQGGGVNFKNPATETFQPDAEENFSAEVEEETPQENSETNSAVGKKEVTTPETLARDAVANGAGALTKKTVTRPEQENSAPATSAGQNAIQIPQSNDLTNAERGKAVLREFQEEDRQLAGAQNNFETATETPKTFQNNFVQSQQGGVYWIVILVFAIVGGFIFVQKFLITDKPKLKKSDLFEDTSDRLKKVSEKVAKSSEKKSAPIKPTYTPPKVTKPVQVKKDNDDKGKHFEVRV